jgi:hypothetical protein
MGVAEVCLIFALDLPLTFLLGGNIDTPTNTYTLMTWYRHFNKKSGEVKIVA